MSRRRLLGVWLLLAVMMVANGIVRETLLVPALGARRAAVASAALGIAIILGVTWWLRPARPPGLRGRAAIALQWVAMTVAFEFVFGHWVDRKPWGELLANYDITEGRLWPLVLASLAAAPFPWRSRIGGGETTSHGGDASTGLERIRSAPSTLARGRSAPILRLSAASPAFAPDPGRPQSS